MKISYFIKGLYFELLDMIKFYILSVRCIATKGSNCREYYNCYYNWLQLSLSCVAIVLSLLVYIG